jgi:RHS repeat-associated protein
VVLEKVGTNTAANYTYGNGLLTRGGEMLHYDGHGTMRTATDATETVTATQNWYAYGQLRGSSGSTASPYRFGATSGYRNDNDGGVLHIGARWYDPAIGRWISADPHLGKIEAPLSRNRYNYCEADPVNAIDPDGHAAFLFVVAGLFLAATVLVWMARPGHEPGAIGVGVGPFSGSVGARGFGFGVTSGLHPPGANFGLNINMSEPAPPGEYFVMSGYYGLGGGLRIGPRGASPPGYYPQVGLGVGASIGVQKQW